MTTTEIATLHDEVRELAREQNAVILAHNYQVPEVQDVADYVGDSLGLSRQAAATDADTIVFCGVHFMAETAAIVSPEKTVLIPDPDAGCSLASSITAAELRAWKAQHPGAIVVSYVNTTAEVKAESDYCCTSGNAKAVIEAIPADREILFLPDMYLGLLARSGSPAASCRSGSASATVLLRASGRPTSSAGEARGSGRRAARPPRDGGYAASQAMAFGNERTHILSTEGMVKFAQESPRDRFVIATEVGIIHRLSREVPEKRFEAVQEAAVCRFMKMITLEKLRDSLRDGQHVVTVEPAIAGRARGAIERMIAIG